MARRIILATQSDERLAALAARGHEQAFVLLVERHRRSLHGLALRLVPFGEAEDCVQQTLLQAWAALQRGTQVGHPSGWLHAALRSVAIRRRMAPPAPAALDAEGGDGLRVVDDAGLGIALEVREMLAAVAALPDHQRTALVRTALEGHSRSEVALELGATEGAVGQMLHRARTTLRAAASAVLPLPVLEWLAFGPAPMAGEALGGLGVAGAVKGAAALVAVSAAAGGTTVALHHRGDRPAHARAVAGRTAQERSAPAPSLSLASDSGHGRHDGGSRDDGASSHSGRRHGGGSRDDGASSHSGPDRSGSGHGGGPGSSTKDESSGHGSSGGGGQGGGGGGDDGGGGSGGGGSGSGGGHSGGDDG